MLAHELRDIIGHFDPVGRDRAELIEHIQELERQRSAWELRVRACTEREELYKTFLNDMGAILAATFQAGHNAVSDNAEKAALLTEAMARVLKRVEEI